jgi:hypothetical protein
MSGPGDDTHPWPWGKKSGDDFTPWPLSKSWIPSGIKELIGRKVRLIKPGDKQPQDYEAGRVTFLVDDQGRIKNVFFEKDLPTK